MKKWFDFCVSTNNQLAWWSLTDQKQLNLSLVANAQGGMAFFKYFNRVSVNCGVSEPF